jgi:hypothetical protein
MIALRCLLALVLLVVATSCERGRKSTTAPEGGAAASGGGGEARAAVVHARVAHFTCVTLDACVDPIRRGLAPRKELAEQFLGASFTKAFDVGAPAGVWVYATPPSSTSFVVVLPVRDEEAALQQLAVWKLKVEKDARGFTVQGLRGRFGGGRLLIATDPALLDVAEIAPEPAAPRLEPGVIMHGDLVFDRVPPEVRGVWETRLRERIESDDGTFAEQTKRATRLESALDAVRDGDRVDFRVRSDPQAGLVMRWSIVPRAGTWLSEYVAANTRVRSKLPVLVPKDSLVWGTYVERDSWRPEDSAQFLAQMEAAREIPGEALAANLGAPPELAPDLAALAGPVIALLEDFARNEPLESVAWMPRGEMAFVVALRGPDPVQLGKLLSLSIATLRKHPVPAIRSVRSHRAKGLEIHELVVPTSGEFGKRFGPNAFVTAALADDVLLVRIADDGDAKPLAALRKQLARAALQDVKMRELHVDFGEIIAALAPGGQFAGALFGIAPGMLAFELEVAVDGPAMVTEARTDLVKMMQALTRMSAWTKPASP